MKYISNIIKISTLLAVSAVLVLSCNKEPEQFTETFPVPTGLTLGETLAANADDSLFNRLVIKGGMAAVLNDSSNTHTLFVPDNNAVIASFGGSLASANATIAALPAENCAGIVKYHMVPRMLASADVVHNFPNLQQPTDIIIAIEQGFLIPATSFPSKNTVSGQFYYNNVPVVATDEVVSNGVIHHIAFIATPPTGTLKTVINADPALTYFSAAVLRADSGQTDLNRFDSLLNYGLTNMTILVPNDAAFQTVIYGIVYTKVFALTGDATIANQQATAAVAAGPAIFQNPALFGDLPAAAVRGIIAYHLLGYLNPVSNGYEPIYRVFSTNLPATPSFQTTLVNAAVAIHPGVMAQTTYTGPFATGLKFTGYGTFPSGGAPFSDPPANAVAFDKLAVNGVYHVLDKVLFPQ